VVPALSRLALFALFLLFPLTGSALLINNLDSEFNDWDRSSDRPASHIGKNFDFSGVGRSSDGWWATMISDRHFLSANHAHPGLGSTITFFQHNPDGTFSNTVTRTVSSGQRIFTSDLWVGTLSSPVSSGIAIYDIYNPLDDDSTQLGGSPGSPADLRNNPEDVTDIIFMVGRSNLTSESSFRIGVNDFIDSLEFFTNTFPDGVVYRINYDDPNGDRSSPVDEAYFLSGDSGAPTFFAPTTNSMTMTELLITGIHSGNTSGQNPGNGADSIDTAPGFSSYLEEIQTITAVPEPAAGILILGLVSFLFLIFHRSRGLKKPGS